MKWFYIFKTSGNFKQFEVNGAFRWVLFLENSKQIPFVLSWKQKYAFEVPGGRAREAIDPPYPLVTPKKVEKSDRQSVVSGKLSTQIKK